jgi:hypothetical protein
LFPGFATSFESRLLERLRDIENDLERERFLLGGEYESYLPLLEYDMGACRRDSGGRFVFDLPTNKTLACPGNNQCTVKP